MEASYMKIEKLNESMTSFVIGVRFRANFSIEDQLGSIVDKILYSRGAYFNSKFFPLVSSAGNGKVLHNDEEGKSLIINNSNIILEIGNCENYKSSQIEEICNKFNEKIITGVLKECKITEISRIGFVNRYLFKNPSLAHSFLEKSIGKALQGINDINLKFSRKYPTEKSLAKEEMNDYHIAIYNIIKKSDKDELFISLDYQKCFDPFLESSTSIEFKEFMSNMRKYNNQTFINWITNNYLTEEHEKSKSSK